jgi:hypothetical protein
MTVAEGDDVQLFLKIAQVSDLRSLDAHTFEQFIQFVFKRFGFLPRLTNADSLNIRPTRVRFDLLRADALTATALVVNGRADAGDVTVAIESRAEQGLTTAFLVTTEPAEAHVRTACTEHDIRLVDAHSFTEWIDKSRLGEGAEAVPPPALKQPAPAPTLSQFVAASARTGASSSIGLGVLLALNGLGVVIALGVAGLARYTPVMSASQTATVLAGTPRPTITPTPTLAPTVAPLPTIKLPATVDYRDDGRRPTADGS